MTITSLSQSTPSRWGELSCARPAVEPRESTPKPLDKTERAEAERDGPRRSPLFGAIKEALTELLAQADAPATAEGTDTEAAETAQDSDVLEQAITEFARALMQALREERGSHGEGRGRHFGHTHGRHLGWGNDAAQGVEKLAREVAPPPTAEAVEAPVESAAESPWKSAHDGLIESFAEVQRALGRPKAERDNDDSLEERLQQMLVALAAKLRANAVHTAALAPAGSLLSVVA